jgi:hypothetical protein
MSDENEKLERWHTLSHFKNTDALTGAILSLDKFMLLPRLCGGMSAWIIRYLGTGTSIQCVCLYTVLYVLLF